MVMMDGIPKLHPKFGGFCDVYFFVICFDVYGCMTCVWNSTDNDVYFLMRIWMREHKNKKVNYITITTTTWKM